MNSNFAATVTAIHLFFLLAELLLVRFGKPPHERVRRAYEVARFVFVLVAIPVAILSLAILLRG